MSVRDDYPAVAILHDAWTARDRTGQTPPQAVQMLNEIERLRSYCDAWMNGVADVVEQFGYDRRAASGPADLLPGLTTLVDQRNDLWERVCELETRAHHARRHSEPRLGISLPHPVPGVRLWPVASPVLMRQQEASVMTRRDRDNVQLARAADVAAAAFRQGGWRWTGGHHDGRADPYEPSAVDIALALVGMMRDVAESTEEFTAIHSGRFRVERVIDRVDERVTTSILLELGESAEPLPEGVTPLPYAPDQDEIPNQGRGEDLDRTEGDDAPELAADAGTQSEPACGVDGPVGQDHGGAAGEPEPITEGAGASDPPHAALDFIVGAEHDRRADGTTRIGVEDHRNFPVGEWTRLYVPTARIDECIAALDALGSGAGTLDESGAS